jgi:hypothetical protein
MIDSSRDDETGVMPGRTACSCSGLLLVVAVGMLITSSFLLGTALWFQQEQPSHILHVSTGYPWLVHNDHLSVDDPTHARTAGGFASSRWLTQDQKEDFRMIKNKKLSIFVMYLAMVVVFFLIFLCHAWDVIEGFVCCICCCRCPWFWKCLCGPKKKGTNTDQDENEEAEEAKAGEADKVRETV